MISSFINKLKSFPEYKDLIVHHQEIPASDAGYELTEKSLNPLLDRILSLKEIKFLYSHQVAAIRAVRAGKNVIVSTPTASGKTLVYNIPVVESSLSDLSTKALYIFPLKALEQDQLKAFREIADELEAEKKITAEIYDGDTSSYRRKKIKTSLPNVIITNPDMLHVGILAYHHQWREFFQNLKFVVIDELHTYRGIFGTHVLQVIRRLKRICKFYGSNPQFITCSATIANPKLFAEKLIELPFELVNESTAPTSTKHFLFVNPILSPHTEAAKLFRLCIAEGFKTIAFTKARKITELIHTWVIQADPLMSSKISSYRAGFLPEERRQIEKMLFNDELQGVISTSALEMGIDIGGLDVCILVGYPGTIMSTWQRGGRVGRGDTDSLIILLAGADALDQYFMRHPRDFFERNFEQAVVDPHNEPVAKRHLVCAASEVPINAESDQYDLQQHAELFQELELESKLLRSAAGNEWFSTEKYPQRNIDIRSIGEGYTIFKEGTRHAIGSIDGFRTFTECHEGAIYLHQARQYLITSLDTEHKNIYARREDVDYYTTTQTEKETEILSTDERKPIANFIVNKGRVKVTHRVIGYEKRRILGQDLLSTHPLDLPPQIFETVGMWVEIEDVIKKSIEQARLHFMGGIHAMEHATISLFPLFALCDRNDIGGISYPAHPQLGKSAVFIYDGYPGGVGLAERGYEIVEELLTSTLKLIAECDCEQGCPSCIHSPKCGSGNKPLDKLAAGNVLKRLLGEIEITPGASENDGGEKMEDAIVCSEGNSEKRNRILYFDLETQRSAEEVGGWQNIHLMRLAVGVVYDSVAENFKVFGESEVQKLIEELKSADLVVGFNLNRFDYIVLSAYSAHDFSSLNTFDILDYIKDRLGYRLSLDHLAQRTLQVQKIGDGLQSIQWFREGQLDKVIEYCKKDVEITRKIFEFGLENEFLVFEDKRRGLVRLTLDWDLENIINSRVT